MNTTVPQHTSELYVLQTSDSSRRETLKGRNDPTNEKYNDLIFLKDDQQWKFNELERRKTDLCNLISANCNGLSVPITVSAIKSLQLSTLFE